MLTEIDIKSPVNSVYVIEDKLIVACGGGPGIKNKLILYQLNQGFIGEKLIENDLQDSPNFIEGIPSKKIFGTCTKNTIIFYSISPNFRSFKKLYTLNISPIDIILISFKIHENLLALGDIEGNLKLYKINFNPNNEILSLTELNSLNHAHWRGINKIEFINRTNLKFILTASGDGNCKLFDIKDLPQPIKFITNFSFRQSLSESANYCMNDLLYLPEKNIAYTIQSSKKDKKAKSFMTQWDLSNVNNIKPIDTINISDSPCTSMDITEDKKYVGVADTQGRIIFVDRNKLKICGEDKIGEIALKCCKFYKNYFISGSIGYTLRIDKLKSGFNSTFLKYIFYAFLICGICYYIYLKKNKLLDENI